jgi:hypothetical protein
LQFRTDGVGIAVYGYGQTIYAKIEFIFAVSGDSLTLKYLESAPFQRFAGFTPDEQTREKNIQFTLESGDYVFKEDVTGTQFRFASKLSLSDSPFPVGLEFPYSVPTEFYGFRERIEN